MGVPKFFRWISERYPLIYQNIDIENPGPIFDALYLDINGLIHNCVSANEEDILGREDNSEEEIFLKIFQYIENLFNIAKPRKLFYIAVDGVAPRAKLNQQRQRRFRSVKDRKEAIKERIAKGLKTSSDPFDPNSISPGTEFMARLSEHLKFYVRKKIKEDPAWQNIRIIFSGPEVAGEGEHKIIEYIRHGKSQADWDPNQTHCIYGFDADLVMLALASHEPHFAILREEGLFDKKKKSKKGDRAEFNLFHVSLLREYLELEFSQIKDHISFQFDVERIIDDFILLSFFLGNDFLPNLALFDNSDNPLDILFQAYKQFLKDSKGYLVEDGKPVASRLEVLFQKLSSYEREFIHKAQNDNQTENVESKPVNESQWKSEYYSKFKKYSKNFKMQELNKSYIEGLHFILSYYFNGVPSWSWYYPHYFTPLVSDLTHISNIKINHFSHGAPLKPLEQLLALLPPDSSSKKLLPETYANELTRIVTYNPEDVEILPNNKIQPEGIFILPFIDEKTLQKIQSISEASLTEAEKIRNKFGYTLTCIYDTNIKEDKISTLPSYFEDILECNSKFEPFDLPPIPNGKSPFRFLPKATPGKANQPGIPTLKSVTLTGEPKTLSINLFGNITRKESLVLSVADKYTAEQHSEIATKFLKKSCWLWPYFREAFVEAIVAGEYEYKDPPDGKEPVFHKLTGEESRWLGKDAEWLQAKWKNNKAVEVSPTVLLSLKTLVGIRHERDGKITKRWSTKLEKYPLSLVFSEPPIPGDFRFSTAHIENIAERFPVGSSAISTVETLYGAHCVIEAIEPSGQIKVNIPYSARVFEPSFLKEFLQSNSGERYSSLNTVARDLDIVPRTLSKITASVKFEPGRHNFGLNIKFSGRNQQVLGYTRRRQLPEGGYGPWEYSDEAIKVLKDYKAKYPEIFLALETDLFRDIYSTNTLFDPAKITHIDFELIKKVAADEGKDVNEEDLNDYDDDPDGDSPNAKGRDDDDTYEMMKSNPLRVSTSIAKIDTLPQDPEQRQKLKILELKAWLKSLPCSKLPRVVCGSVSLPNDAVKNLEAKIDEWVDTEKALQLKHGSKNLISVSPQFLLSPLKEYESHSLSETPQENLFQLFNVGDRVVNLRGYGAVPLGARGTVVAVKGNFVEVLFDKQIIGGLDLDGLCSPLRGQIVVKESLLNLGLRHSSGGLRKSSNLRMSNSSIPWDRSALSRSDGAALHHQDFYKGSDKGYYPPSYPPNISQQIPSGSYTTPYQNPLSVSQSRINNYPYGPQVQQHPNYSGINPSSNYSEPLSAVYSQHQQHQYQQQRMYATQGPPKGSLFNEHMNTNLIPQLSELRGYSLPNETGGAKPPSLFSPHQVTPLHPLQNMPPLQPELTSPHSKIVTYEFPLSPHTQQQSQHPLSHSSKTVPHPHPVSPRNDRSELSSTDKDTRVRSPRGELESSGRRSRGGGGTNRGGRHGGNRYQNNRGGDRYTWQQHQSFLHENTSNK